VTCQDFKCRVPEEPFEVPGSTRSPQSRAPFKGRQNANLQVNFFYNILFSMFVLISVFIAYFVLVLELFGNALLYL